LAKTSLLRTLGTATDAQITPFDSLKHAPVTVSLEEAVKEAYRNRPDLYMAELNVRMQREKIHSVRGAYLPEVDLVLSHDNDRVRSDTTAAGTAKRSRVWS
jgi:outer membrane protein TolC